MEDGDPMKTALPFALVLAVGLFLLNGGGPAGFIVGLIGFLVTMVVGRQMDIDARERAEEARFWSGREGRRS
jgi:hypothetical protein